MRITRPQIMAMVDLMLAAPMGSELDLIDAAPNGTLFVRIHECWKGVLAVDEVAKDYRLPPPGGHVLIAEVAPATAEVAPAANDVAEPSS
jgi:hypothetical protein